MLKFLFVALMLALVWMLGKDAAMNVLLRPPADAAIPVAASYDRDDGWLVRPAEATPGAWATPWGVDVFLILPAPRVADRTVILDPAGPTLTGAGARETFTAIADPLGTIGPVYAPAYRMIAPAAFRLPAGDSAIPAARALATEDILSAFTHYLDVDNRGRAFLIVAVAEGGDHLPFIQQRIEADPRLVGLTVGYVHLKAPDYAAASEPMVAQCMEGVGRPCLIASAYQPELPVERFFLPQLPVRALPALDAVWSPEMLGSLDARARAASLWLDEFAAKPAPPLPPMESIEVAPIRRAGDVDPDAPAPDSGPDQD